MPGEEVQERLTLESCRNTTPHTLASTKYTRCRQEKQKVTSDEVEPKTQCGFGETHGLTPEMFDPQIDVGTELELQHLQAEERRLRRSLRCYERRLERCAAVNEALAELEESVAEALKLE